MDLRVYVTDPQGIVVFDSDAGRDVGQDDSRYPGAKGLIARPRQFGSPWLPFRPL